MTIRDSPIKRHRCKEQLEAATLNRNSTQTLKIIRSLRFIHRRFIREAEIYTQRERKREPLKALFLSFLSFISLKFSTSGERESVLR